MYRANSLSDYEGFFDHTFNNNNNLPPDVHRWRQGDTVEQPNFNRPWHSITDCTFMLRKQFGKPRKRTLPSEPPQCLYTGSFNPEVRDIYLNVDLELLANEYAAACGWFVPLDSVLLPPEEA
jgi:hypothetical protein